jgi:hypothetical protein
MLPLSSIVMPPNGRVQLRCVAQRSNVGRNPLLGPLPPFWQTGSLIAIVPSVYRQRSILCHFSRSAKLPWPRSVA